ncbi:enoyl-CoA hydratase [Salipaludibacillus sp. CUR1]|uniref:MaoC/PaaZ C-terminal domain-containing protein n=1 Tax=Salipaludibacillus sp. CUR1 TaxID=2820003 RepID=UPI001E5799C0|nr:MaoC/PaaZ C-terminal domain-containing protein [Salipaludibacillus sp. CUR1]MCE7793374.1 enoyl-CoA hydratase [Salipaludibacillus sp. CUR1]
MFTKKRKIGRTISQLKPGDEYNSEKKVEDKDILLYLGFTNDANPVYIQHDYASRTPFQKPIVPHIMLNGYISSAVSMHLPGPGSVILDQNLSFPKPLYHYGTLKLKLTLEKIEQKEHRVSISVHGRDEYDDTVVKGSLTVCPPYPWKPVTHDTGTFENF